ncbi:hypothetical protein [Halovenus salina]|uniref:DUF2268 domain-containing protein n=1 Tax=Halovenus salina TaxID=1510225 RepID=A0ABD5W6E1_9EURY|nr:hypothetical protein [Halovenus salina]
MKIDASAARLFLSYLDGDTSLTEVWNHPAYDVVRSHADLFGREVTERDVAAAASGEETVFARNEPPTESRDRIAGLLDHVRAHATEWTEQISKQLRRATHEDDLSEVTVYLGVGYTLGAGLDNGAYIDLNEPLFFEYPRQVLYTAIHESSHVVYEQEHEARKEFSLEGDALARAETQWDVFNTVFHTEAYATYTPLACRRADGAVGTQDHVVCEDYAILSDTSRLETLVEQYDSLRETLQQQPVSRDRLFGALLSDDRLPYRVGCAMLDALERTAGAEAVRDGFYNEPGEFCKEHDALLDEYRTLS